MVPRELDAELPHRHARLRLAMPRHGKLEMVQENISLFLKGRSAASPVAIFPKQRSRLAEDPGIADAAAGNADQAHPGLADHAANILGAPDVARAADDEIASFRAVR